MAVVWKHLQSFGHSQAFLLSLFPLVHKILVFSLGLRCPRATSLLTSCHQTHSRSCHEQVKLPESLSRYLLLCLQGNSHFSRSPLTNLLDVTDDPRAGRDRPIRFLLFVFIASCQRVQMVPVPLCIAFVLWEEPRVAWVRTNTSPHCLITRTRGYALSFISSTVT